MQHSYIYVPFPLLILSLLDDEVDFFILAVVNHAAMNVGMQVSHLYTDCVCFNVDPAVGRWITSVY